MPSTRSFTVLSSLSHYLPTSNLHIASLLPPFTSWSPLIQPMSAYSRSVSHAVNPLPPPASYSTSAFSLSPASTLPSHLFNKSLQLLWSQIIHESLLLFPDRGLTVLWIPCLLTQSSPSVVMMSPWSWITLEHQHQLKAWLCIYCRVTGHLLASCPLRPKRRLINNWRDPGEPHFPFSLISLSVPSNIFSKQLTLSLTSHWHIMNTYNRGTPWPQATMCTIGISRSLLLNGSSIDPL